jgi:4,5-dihydroxyphthalate decarboxylase
MSIALTIATTDYDHFRDFRFGLVRAEGIDVNWLTLGHHEIFSRFTFNREWDVSELSFAKFSAQVTRKDSDIIGLPVYPSRLFRFASFYVNRKAGITTAKDLRGKRVGVPEWAHTAAVYMRGWLMHDAGVALSEVDWVQAGTNESGRIEKVELSLPKGVRLTSMPEKTLSGMIASGELDCVIIARPPKIVPGKASRCCAPVSRFRIGGATLLRRHACLSDHARHCDAQGGSRGKTLGCAQLVQCV